MSQDTEFVRAFFKVLTGAQRNQQIRVHFNPVSLQYQVQNTMQQQGGGAQQFVSQSTGKLTMDLVFDTTHDGTDVRNLTVKVAKLMEPENRIPPSVAFEWGAYKFEGTVESYKETIDFFSPNGVPLRASVNLTLAAAAEKVFTGGSSRRSSVGGNLRATAVQFPSPDPRSKAFVKPTAGSPSDAANKGGNPAAARGIGALNGSESLRFGAGGSLNIAAGVTLGPPKAFASGGAGLGIGAGAGIGIGGGIGIGIGASAGAGIGIGGAAGAAAGFGASAGAGFGASAGASFGASAGAGFGGSASAGFGASAGAGFGASAGASFGASAGAGFGASASAGAGFASASSGGFGVKVTAGGVSSAGVSASQGAFAGLSVKQKTVSTGNLEVTRLVGGADSTQVSVGAEAGFAVGGRALAEGNASLRADVGAGVRGRLTWDGG